MVKKRITKKEVQTRLGFILLGVFAFYLATPLQEWIGETFGATPLNQIIIGIIGILVVLYYFDF